VQGSASVLISALQLPGRKQAPKGISRTIQNWVMPFLTVTDFHKSVPLMFSRWFYAQLNSHYYDVSLETL
jgi:hypothetical protein